MAVVVFDADVLIGYLNSDDVHHAAAVRRVTNALVPGTGRLISAVNYTEILIGPLRAAGQAGAGVVDAMLARFGIGTVDVGAALARDAAALRADESLKLPDAYAVATALQERRRGEDVRLESFDERVCKTFARLA